MNLSNQKPKCCQTICPTKLSSSSNIIPPNMQPEPCSSGQFNIQPKSHTGSMQIKQPQPLIVNPYSIQFDSYATNKLSHQPALQSTLHNQHTLKSCNNMQPRLRQNSPVLKHLFELPWALAMTAALLLSLPVSTKAVDKKHTLHISVLVPDDDVRPFTRKQMQPAIELAVEKVTDPGGLLQEVDVHVHYADSKCSIAYGIRGAIELHYRGEADVFLGPVCDYTAAPVARQSVFWDTPVLTYAQAKDFRAEAMLSKVTRVGNDFFQLGEFLNTVFKRNGTNWHKFNIIYDPTAWDSLIDKMGHIMAESIHATMYQLTGHISTYYKMNLEEVKFDELLLDQVGTEFAGEYIALL
ncbi:atrial natriuretic peptide receptor 3-like [Elysia marginata]|uniref:Atrial natriuretic peptide receptor 3-like n=1 Tax=Elysia marginata TaxID=1093978 RepID=A0AAV4GYP3_9GAST|nr:atrial natriuretic peptide receptor 3-like [Elysia marginata]